jgi:hypothetical protein
MMLWLASTYPPPDAPPVAAEFLKNVRTEAVALHLRNLIVFLYPDQFPPKSDDVCAHHFLASRTPYADWLKRRPRLSSTLRQAKDRADREVAHLTTGRIAGTPAFKYWDVDRLVWELGGVLVVFADSAATDRLGVRARSAIDGLATALGHRGHPPRA